MRLRVLQTNQATKAAEMRRTRMRCCVRGIATCRSPPRKREGAPRGSFLSELRFPCAIGFRAVELAIAVRAMAARKTVVARVLRQRGLFGRLPPHRPRVSPRTPRRALRTALAFIRHVPPLLQLSSWQRRKYGKEAHPQTGSAHPSLCPARARQGTGTMTRPPRFLAVQSHDAGNVTLRLRPPEKQATPRLPRLCLSRLAARPQRRTQGQCPQSPACSAAAS